MKTIKKKTKIVLIVAAIVILVAGITIGGFFGGVEIVYNAAKDDISVEIFDASTSGDRIHFLNTASSDAIILESDGHFAMIDAAEDTDNPRGFSSLNSKGWENEVLNYLWMRCAVDGKVTLDFVLGTHAHSDHIGGFDTIIGSPFVTIKKAFLKKYNPDVIDDYEKREWDNEEVYNQMMNALIEEEAEIVSDIPSEPFSFGNLTIQFVNNENETKLKNLGENDNAVGTIISKGGVKAFLAADMDNKSGDESRCASVIGKVDLLKVGHHGYGYSTTWDLLGALQPRITVACNFEKNMSSSVKLRLKIAKSAVYGTGELDGIVAEFQEGGFQLFRSIYEGVPRG